MATSDAASRPSPSSSRPSLSASATGTTSWVATSFSCSWSVFSMGEAVGTSIGLDYQNLLPVHRHPPPPPAPLPLDSVLVRELSLSGP
ncbi:hypothetical protein CDL15_Pgr011528 [Punica granatum]|nr:hypothetical protein CDL15_Pgr011528 [Punica granatum]